MSNDTITVRASSLTTWPDCERRFAAKMMPDLVEAAGFTLRRVPSQIGAKVGTAVHSGAAHMLQHKIKTGELGKRQDATEAAMESLHDEIQMGTNWDETTPTINTAEKQTARMVSIYHLCVAPLIKPVAVELELTARFSDTLVITGHMDVAEDEEIRDTKTGVMQRPNHPQYGAYSLLRRSMKKTVNRFWEDYIPRNNIGQPQKEPRALEYP
ncbi:MAG: PD-(D/E)XK nuclease family protein, partial [Alphaproteobacteria bacterium]